MPQLRAILILATFALLAVAAANADPPKKTPDAAGKAVPAAPVDLVGEDWPRFLGPTGDGKSTERILLKWPKDGLSVHWFRPVGEGYSAPSIAEGRVFVFDREGDEARLAAWDVATGAEQWRVGYPSAYEDLYQYSGGPRTSPVIDGDRVYTHGVGGRLRAHAVQDGKLLWDVDTVERFGVVQNFFGVGATPVVEGDLLIVQIGGSPENSPKISSGEVEGNGTGIIAFDKRTGEVRYKITDQLASYSTASMATIGARRWGFVFTRGGLVGFEPLKGTVDFFFPWRAKILESVNAMTPVVVNDTVFISESYSPGSALLKVRSGGYEVQWKDPRRDQSLSLHWSTPIHHQGILFASSGQSSGEAELRAVEHATGKVLWREPGLGRSTLLYADGHLLVLTENGRLLLVKATSERYQLVAEMDLGSGTAGRNEDAKEDGAAAVDRPRLRFPAWNAPVLSHGRLYLRGRDQIICLDLAPR